MIIIERPPGIIMIRMIKKMMIIVKEMVPMMKKML